MPRFAETNRPPELPKGNNDVRDDSLFPTICTASTAASAISPWIQTRLICEYVSPLALAQKLLVGTHVVIDLRRTDVTAMTRRRTP